MAREIPTEEDIEKWLEEGYAETPDGCVVEPDGVCPHGYKSWLLILGLI